ncbi:MAG: ClbS/DfsB family four-helix bundle protein [Dehalococcoidia bacterium]|nr:ClbS/DfsB family four-helix bundle protein [Dehalococcoidia bacterium]
MTKEDQLNNLDNGVEWLISCIETLDDKVFHKKMNDWSPRDVLAHLIGWNRYTVEGCRQIKQGETPDCLVDPGEDFARVNAVSVRKYRSRDKHKLIQELRASSSELNQFLSNTSPTARYTDYGVKYQGAPLTIRNMVDGLIQDYFHHGKQIQQWAGLFQKSALCLKCHSESRCFGMKHRKNEESPAPTQ